MAFVRPPAVAGSFYPSDARQLEATVLSYLAAAAAQGPAPKAIIAPHAGYAFSGVVAAAAYASLFPARGRATRVVLIGPSHRVPFRGIAVSSADAYATPLGEVPVDLEMVARLCRLPEVGVLDAAHAQEHSLEVHLPFLQKVLGQFRLVPLVAGRARAEAVARVLDEAWGGPETVIVVSSDLSHYLPYEAARQLDATTARAIEALDAAAVGEDQACGQVPIAGLLTVARRRRMAVRTLDIRNSGDTAGPRDGVVGYGSWSFLETPEGATADAETGGVATVRGHAGSVLRTALASIRAGMANGRPLAVSLADHPEALRGQGACFVTLKRNGQLRGCMGSAAAWRPLIEDVAENAFRAAFRDPRFPPLREDEFEGLALSVSVLSAPQPLRFRDETDLVGQLRPGGDGLIIQDAGRRALFLPSVWEMLPDPRLFLSHLKVKAGLAPDHWSQGFQAHRFSAIEIKDEYPARVVAGALT